jgi:hypothetical protein
VPGAILRILPFPQHRVLDVAQLKSMMQDILQKFNKFPERTFIFEVEETHKDLTTHPIIHKSGKDVQGLRGNEHLLFISNRDGLLQTLVHCLKI